jgi:hypothetical protein
VKQRRHWAIHTKERLILVLFGNAAEHVEIMQYVQVWDYLQFQVSTEDLAMNPLWVSIGCAYT